MFDHLHRLITVPIGAIITVSSATASWVIAAVSPWQEHVDWGMRVCASAVAICVGLYTLRKKRKSN